MIGVLACVAGAVQLGRVAQAFAMSSQRFAIREIEVTGNERLSLEELEAAMGVAEGTNIFARTPDELETALEGLAWIAEAHVRRRLPGSLVVSVRERTARLVLDLGEPYLVDDEGLVFKTLAEGDPDDLPLLTGVDALRFRTERAYRTSVLTDALALLSEWQASPIARRESLGAIHVEPSEELTIFIGDEGLEARLGRGPYRAKLARLRRVLDELARRQARPLYVYLDNVRRPDRVTVRVREDRVTVTPGASATP